MGRRADAVTGKAGAGEAFERKGLPVAWYIAVNTSCKYHLGDSLGGWKERKPQPPESGMCVADICRGRCCNQRYFHDWAGTCGMAG